MLLKKKIRKHNLKCLQHPTQKKKNYSSRNIGESGSQNQNYFFLSFIFSHTLGMMLPGWKPSHSSNNRESLEATKELPQIKLFNECNRHGHTWLGIYFLPSRPSPQQNCKKCEMSLIILASSHGTALNHQFTYLCKYAGGHSRFRILWHLRSTKSFGIT